MIQKVVIKVTCNCSKARTKALKVAVSVPGVDEAAFRGEDKGQIEVTGTVDAVKLTTLLRKNLRYAELISVSEVDGKEKEKDDDKEKPSEHLQVFPYAWPPATYVHGFYQPPANYQYSYNDPNCIIM